MSMNVRTPPSPNYPTTPNASSSPTAAPSSSASAQLTALAVAMETLKTALGALPPAGGQGAAAPQGPAGEVQAGVSSFAPSSAPGSVSAASGVRGASAPGVDPALARTPAGQAQGALAQEQQRLQGEKYNFPDHLQKGVGEFNQKQGEKNAKVQEKLTRLDADIAAERAGGGDSKKLKKMEDERKKAAGELKPPLDPAKVTSEIDAVMNDPQIPEKDRKGKLEDIRKKYGLEKHGGSLSMDTFTRHLSSKTSESKDRVGELQKTHMKQLDGQIKQAKETHGKDSPQVKALEAQKKGVDGLYNQQKDTLKAQSDTLWNSFRKVGFGEKVGNFFKGIAKGVGNLVKGVFNTLTAIPKGLVNGAKALFKGDIGGAFKEVGKGIGNAVTTGAKTISDGLPLIATAAAFIPGLQPIALPLALASSAQGVVQSAKNGDAFGVVASLAGGVAGGAGAMAARGASGAATAGSAAARSAPAAGGAAAAGGSAAAAGSAAARSMPAAGGAAAAGGSAAAGGASAARWEKVALGADLVGAGANTAKGLQEGDYFGAAGAAAGGVSRGASAFNNKTDATTPPATTTPTKA